MNVTIETPTKSVLATQKHVQLRKVVQRSRKSIKLSMCEEYSS